jgi:[ribosomal protein S5]-alanine N-acetyltransferase
MIPTIETERLILRPFSLRDAPEVKRLAGDRAISDTTINIPYPYEDGMAEEWISRHQEEFTRGEGVTFAIVKKEGELLIGAIGLREISEDGEATLGYWIGKSFWNQGFCTEAALEVLCYAFTVLDLTRINATHLTHHTASGRVMEKLGMRHEGGQSRYVMKWGRFEYEELFSRSKNDWEKRAG